MQLPDLKYDYYNALITDVKSGPRREVTLTMQVHPNRHNWAVYETVTVRFGGIFNMDSVKRSFKSLAEQLDTVYPLHYLRYATDQTSKPGSLFVEMGFDRSGEQIRIHCSNISLTVVKA